MKIYKITSKLPTIINPESQLEYKFDCTEAKQNSPEMEIINLMDNNPDFKPNLKTRRYLENKVGAVKNDYAIRFKQCTYNNIPYIAAYFSAIHYIFKVNP